MSLYTVYAMNLGGSLISGCTDEQSASSGIEEAVIQADGSPNVNEVVPLRLGSEMSFVITSLAALLEKLSFAGWAIDSPLQMWCQKMTSVGRSTGSDHVRLTVNAGVVIPETLTASEGAGGAGRITARVIPSWDGVNEMIVPAAAALSGTPAVTEVFTVGPMKLNGAWIGQVQSTTVTFGIRIDRHYGDGEGRPRLLTLASIAPVITVTTTDAALLTSIGLGPGTYAGANSAVYFRRCKGSDTTMRYADNESQHLSIGASGRVTIREVSGSPQTVQIQMTVKKVGASPVLTINTGAVIAL